MFLFIGLPEDGAVIPRQRVVPIITSRKVEFPDRYRPNKVAWLESLNTAEEEKLGLVDLHPDVFATFPRFVNKFLALFAYVQCIHSFTSHACSYKSNQPG